MTSWQEREGKTEAVFNKLPDITSANRHKIDALKREQNSGTLTPGNMEAVLS